MNDHYYGATRSSNYIQHFGIKGMKWGKRKKTVEDFDDKEKEVYNKLTSYLDREFKKSNSDANNARKLASKSAKSADEFSERSENYYNLQKEILDGKINTSTKKNKIDLINTLIKNSGGYYPSVSDSAKLIMYNEYQKKVTENARVNLAKASRANGSR